MLTLWHVYDIGQMASGAVLGPWGIWYVALQVKHPLKNIFSRRYRPELIMAIFIPFFQQMTGAPFLMRNHTCFTLFAPQQSVPSCAYHAQVVPGWK